MYSIECNQQNWKLPFSSKGKNTDYIRYPKALITIPAKIYNGLRWWGISISSLQKLGRVLVTLPELCIPWFLHFFHKALNSQIHVCELLPITSLSRLDRATERQNLPYTIL